LGGNLALCDCEELRAVTRWSKKVPLTPSYDTHQVIGLTVADATQILEANGFKTIEVYDADVNHALTLALNPFRVRLFERNGIVVKI
jgi:hypothetical protein